MHYHKQLINVINFSRSPQTAPAPVARAPPSRKSNGQLERISLYGDGYRAANCWIHHWQTNLHSQP
jgi:hypothetical protein